jgi:LysR family transcriptional regulator, transcriptional activator of the cysJI operon
MFGISGSNHIQGAIVHVETLKVFCDLVESGSFSQSAVQNFITQSAVSQQIRVLEARFNTPLLVRQGRSVHPTEAGRILYEGAREILERFEHMDLRLRSLGEEMTGTVRIATIYSVGLYEMSSVIKTFLKTYPKVNLHVEYSRANRVYEECQSGRADIGVVTYPKPRKGIRVIPLPSDKLILICAPQHPFAKRRTIDLRKLNGQNFVAFERDIPSRRALDQIFKEQNIEVRIVMELDNIDTIKRSVEIGVGLAIVPMFSVQREVQAGTLVQLQFAHRTFFRSLGIIVKQNRALTPAAQKLIELLQRPP